MMLAILIACGLLGVPKISGNSAQALDVREGTLGR
jgi:hypothetical protein